MTALDGLVSRSAMRVINGVSFPALIHNGSYFLTDIGVYEDGLVECWGGHDLAGFQQKVKEGWVVPSIPDGAEISAHHLAHVTVKNAQWHMTRETLLTRVEDIIKQLNPSLTNLYDTSAHVRETGAEVGSAPGSRMGKATWRPDEEQKYLKRRFQGQTAYAFWRGDAQVYVASIALFEDDQVRVNGAGAVLEMSLDDLRGDPRLCVATKGDRIEIAGLCTFEAAEVNYAIAPTDLIGGLEVDRDRLVGRETSMDKTAKAFQEYLQSATSENLEVLRKAYESVPKHMRRYCGDMDTKDTAIRMALYGNDEIENWSHYALAKAQGLPLPTITLPDPAED